MDYQYIFSMKLAGYLMMNGYKLLKIDKNHKYPTRDVYIFEKTENILKEIKTFNK